MRQRRRAVKLKSSGPGVVGRLARAASAAWRPFLVWVVPSVSLVAICVGGLHFCRRHVMTSPEYRVAAPKVSRPNAPWWEKAFGEEIDKSCAFAGGASILDDELLEKIAAGYARCPWVKEVTSLDKQFPNRVAAEISVRWPAAAVEVMTSRGRRYVLVGDDGVRLPKTYATWPQRGLDVPFIVGVRAAAPDAGEAWRDRSVTDAIAIVRLLRQSEVVRGAINITAVDVSNSGGRISNARSEFLVLAENNCVIEWGRAPGTSQPGELPGEEKIRKFESFLAESNQTSNRTLDLRFAGRVVSRRIGTDGDNG